MCVLVCVCVCKCSLVLRLACVCVFVCVCVCKCSLVLRLACVCDSSNAILVTRRERAHVCSQDQAAAAGEAADKSEAKSDKPGTIYGLAPYLCIYTMYMYA